MYGLLGYQSKDKHHKSDKLHVVNQKYVTGKTSQ